MQTPVFDCLSFDPFSFQQDGLSAAEVDIGWREITQALMIPVVIVMVDEDLDLRLKIAWEEVVFQEDAVLQGLVPTLDFALGLGMIGGAANMLHVTVIEPFGEIAGDVAGAIVG